MFFKRSSDTEFTELGIGQMKVLPGNGEGVKAIMRNDTALAKVVVIVVMHSSSRSVCHGHCAGTDECEGH